MATYIGIAGASNQTFLNTLPDDLVVFAAEPARLLLGTQSNMPSKVEVGSDRIVVSDTTTFQNGLLVNGNALMFNDLYVQGNLITRQDLVLSGVQVASGASYCNGDLYVMNNASSFASNANVYITSTYGYPVLSLNQEMVNSHGPMLVYQDRVGAGYITNSNNIYIGRGSTPYATFSNSGWLGIGTSNPRAPLDLYRGNVNARNVMRIRKSLAGSNDIGVTINWEASPPVPGNEFCFVIETTQQLSFGSIQGSRTQRHKLTLGSPYAHVPQVAMSMGDHLAYTALHVGLSNTTATSATLRSYTSGTPVGMGGGIHDVDVNIIIAPSNVGHVWLG